MYFYLIAPVAALGGLLFGCDIAVISGALLFSRQVLALSPTMHGIVVAIALAGAAAAAAVAGFTSDSAGRCPVIFAAGLLFIAGAVGSAGAFLVYAVLSLVALGFIALMVPETKGRTLEQIEAALDAGHSSLPAAKRSTP
jgi:MFS family permease